MAKAKNSALASAISTKQVPLHISGNFDLTGWLKVTAAAVVAVVQAYSKINASGQWVDRSEHVNLNEVFERMTTAELEAL